MNDLKRFGRLMLWSFVAILGYNVLGFELFVTMSIAFITFQLAENELRRERGRYGQ